MSVEEKGEKKKRVNWINLPSITFDKVQDSSFTSLHPLLVVTQSVYTSAYTRGTNSSCKRGKLSSLMSFSEKYVSVSCCILVGD